MRVRATITLLLCASCVPEEGPLMAPGRDCIECHDGGAAVRWTAAGTWARGADVTVTDANGKSVTMRGNKVGNFFTAEPLTPPLTVSVDGVQMPSTALQSTVWSSAHMNYGGCNLCHSGPTPIPSPETWATQLAPLMAPGRDCLRCHDGATATRYTLAGTWNAPNLLVQATDRNGTTVSLTTNQAGNFYTSVPLAFPLTNVRVGGSSMDPPPGYGGCNACHRGGEAEGD